MENNNIKVLRHYLSQELLTTIQYILLLKPAKTERNKDWSDSCSDKREIVFNQAVRHWNILTKLAVAINLRLLAYHQRILYEGFDNLSS